MCNANAKLGPDVAVDLPQTPTRQLTQINPARAASHTVKTMNWRQTMFDANTIKDELQDLKTDIAGLAAATSDALFESSTSHLNSTAEHIKALMTDLGEALESEGTQVERLMAVRPAAVIASAFALGIAVGLLLGRRR
jgi:ElaB/YqjD/DUF883 family membrane-anchored ribosome-binding protein